MAAAGLNEKQRRHREMVKSIVPVSNHLPSKARVARAQRFGVFGEPRGYVATQGIRRGIIHFHV